MAGLAAWFGRYAWAQEFVVTQEGRTQALVTTGHVATGSLILVTSLTGGLAIAVAAGAQRTSGACRHRGGGGAGMSIVTHDRDRGTSRRPSRAFVRVRDYVELTKPKIVVLELVTIIVAACVASWGSPDLVSAGIRACGHRPGGRRARAPGINGSSASPTPGCRGPPTVRCRRAGSRARSARASAACTTDRRRRAGWPRR